METSQPNIRLREVPFGTSFEPVAYHRTKEPEKHGACYLHANEIAVDVGGVCYGVGNEQRFIFDHHFPGATFPCAAAAVLHHAALIRERLANVSAVWIVIHKDPDFDALCSSYLVGQVLSGKIPIQGWEQYRVGTGAAGSEVWFNQRLPDDPQYRWPFALAAYAAHVDNCHRIYAARREALHSVLYAALRRGRNLLTLDGLNAFFGTASSAIADRGLNPFFDGLFRPDSEFGVELQLLQREFEAYQHDLQKARKSIVLLRRSDDFTSWYSQAMTTPFQDARETVTFGSVENLVPADGIYIRDPECLLFKEWVREDTENSTMGTGFLFTAIAYSRGRPEAAINQTGYYFALDPERTDGSHLYNVWEQLQRRELAEIRKNKPLEKHLEEEERKIQQEHEQWANLMPEDRARRANPRKTNCRGGFEERAGPFALFFNDPWFDGGNYRCTIIATPNRGTLIPGGTASDLSDDSVAQIVQKELEYCAFSEEAEVTDYCTEMAKADTIRVPIPGSYWPDLKGNCYRFAGLRLAKNVQLKNRELAAQIGQRLLPFLQPAGTTSDTTALVGQQLIISDKRVVVWNRSGIAVAYTSEVYGNTSEIPENDALRRLASVVVELRLLSAPPVATPSDGTGRLPESHLQRDAPLGPLPSAEETPSISSGRFSARYVALSNVAHGRKLLADIIDLRLRAATPAGAVLQSFLDSTNLDEVLETITALNERLDDEQREKDERLREQAQKGRDTVLQLILAAGTAVGLIFAWGQMEGLKMSDLGIVVEPERRFLVGGLITVLFFGACVGCIVLVPRLCQHLLRKRKQNARVKEEPNANKQ